MYRVVSQVLINNWFAMRVNVPRIADASPESDVPRIGGK